VKFAGRCPKLPLRIKGNDLPEEDKIFQHGESYVKTIKKSIAEELNEKLVVGKVDAVIDPRAMMIHFQVADITDAAVVRSVRLDVLTLFAEPHAIIYRAVENGQICSQMLK